MPKGYTEKEITDIAKGLLDGMTAEQALESIGRSSANARRTCNGNAVRKRMAEIQAEQRKRERELDEAKGIKEPLTKNEYLMLLEDKMHDDTINEQVKAKYIELYGKGIGAFTDKIEVDGNISLAEVLNRRRKKQ